MTSENERFAPLFTSAEDVHNNACVNWCHDPLELYATAYKEAAEKLVKEVVNSHRHQDTLVYPIVFLYRQYIELRLKEIIREGRKLLEEPGDFPMHHRIHELWPIAKTIIEKVFENEEGKPDFGFVEHVLAEFSNYDPESFSFRYPTDKKGNNPLSGLTHINVRHLAETINRLAEILDGASVGISVYRDWKNEMYSSI
jgi:hypothetical protein